MRARPTQFWGTLDSQGRLWPVRFSVERGGTASPHNLAFLLGGARHPFPTRIAMSRWLIHSGLGCPLALGTWMWSSLTVLDVGMGMFSAWTPWYPSGTLGGPGRSLGVGLVWVPSGPGSIFTLDFLGGDLARG